MRNSVLSFFVVFLLFLPQAEVVYVNPECPTKYWINYKRSDGYGICVIATSSRFKNMTNALEVCVGFQSDSHPAVPQNDAEIKFLQNTSYGDRIFSSGVRMDDKYNLLDYKDEVIKNASFTLKRNNGSILLFSKKIARFESAINESVGILCELLQVPYNKQTSFEQYTNLNCPVDDWVKVEVGYVSKCFKKITHAKELYRCTVREWCKESHPSALPASVQSDEDLAYLKTSPRSTYTGIHAPCSLNYMDPDDNSKALFLLPNGQRYKMPDLKQYYNITNPELLVAIGKDFDLEDYPEGSRDQTVACEILLPVKADNKTCPADYLYFAEKDVCIHNYVYNDYKDVAGAVPPTPEAEKEVDTPNTSNFPMPTVGSVLSILWILFV